MGAAQATPYSAVPTLYLATILSQGDAWAIAAANVRPNAAQGPSVFP